LPHFKEQGVYKSRGYSHLAAMVYAMTQLPPETKKGK